MKQFMLTNRLNFRKTIFAFLAGGGMFFVIYGLLACGNKFHRDPEIDRYATRQVKNYRFWPSFRRGHGLWYDTGGFRQFIDSFPKIINAADNDPGKHNNTSKYRWVIGFYWKRAHGGEKNNHKKNSYCIVPTLLEKIDTSWRVIDYFEDAKKDPKNWEYDHTNDKKTKMRRGLDDTKNNAFDNGQLWP